MRIPSGITDQYIYFVAVDATDLKSRETGLSSFTVYRSRNGAAANGFTGPTINETDASNMPGVYELLLDEDMTIGDGNDSEEMIFHITHAGMAPVDRTIELYRPKITAGATLTVVSGIGQSNVKQISDDATAADNLELAADNYSATRGLAGTALPAAAANAAGGLAISTNGGVDLDALAADAARLTAVRAAVLTDWINAGRLDALLDAIKAVTDNLPNSGALTTIGTDTARLTEARAGVLTDWINDGRLDVLLDAIPTTPMRGTDIGNLNDLAASDVLTQVAAALVAIHLDHLLHATYDPANKPGAADALLNELVENNGGVSRYTEAALAQAPSGTGGDATASNQTTIINDLANATDGLGALKVLIDAVGVVTDKFVFTIANQVDANSLTSVGAAGSGDTLVTENSGHDLVANGLRATDGGVGVDGVKITFYLKADYDAQTFTERASTVTDSNGDFENAVNLDDTLEYTAVYTHPSKQLKTQEFTCTA